MIDKVAISIWNIWMWKNKRQSSETLNVRAPIALKPQYHGGAKEALRGPTRPYVERAGDYQSIKCGPHQPADKDGRRKRRCQFGAALLFDDKDYQETGKGSRLKNGYFTVRLTVRDGSRYQIR